jgi:hypothetical protein
VGFRLVLASLLSVALAAAALLVWWYLDAPRDLTMEGIDVGRVSDFSDLKDLPQQDHYVARVRFLSSKDIRKMIIAESTTDGTDIAASPCRCEEKAKEAHGDRCEINLGPFVFDKFGEIQKHYNVSPARSSRMDLSDDRTTYHFYVPLKQWGADEDRYDLAKQPFDLCVRVSRFGYLTPTRTSNMMIVPARALTAAIVRAHTP